MREAVYWYPWTTLDKASRDRVGGVQRTVTSKLSCVAACRPLRAFPDYGGCFSFFH